MSKFKKIKNNQKIQELSSKSKSVLNNSWAVAVGGANNFTSWLANTDFIRGLNDFSSDISKAMDAAYIDPLRTEAMNPSNHRILDGGHTLTESLSRGFNVGLDKGLNDFESFVEWGKAYVTDLSSPGGMPAFEGLTNDVYNILKAIGVSDKTAIDAVTVNGQEALEALIGGSLTAVALVFSWKKKDKENFSRAVSAIGISSIISLNPLLGLIALVALAIGYNQSMIDKSAMVRGGMLTGAVIGIGAIIPGPMLLGTIPAIVIAIYLNKNLKKEVPIAEQLKQVITLLNSKDFKDEIKEHFDKANDQLIAAVNNFSSRMKKSAG